MNLPSSAIFAFNANLDYVKYASDEDLAAIEEFSPILSGQISESFAYGMQKEVAIDIRACEFFLKKMKFDKTVVGGQAGNGAQMASALGVKSFLHTNYPNEELCKKFAHPENIMIANEKGFAPATGHTSHIKSGHHFVLENKENHIRFIASYDPFPMHPEDNFCFNIGKELPGITKAFLGGFHLIKTQSRVGKFAQVVREWKAKNPALQVFVELGEFQMPEVMDATRAQILPLASMIGLNDLELAQMGAEPEELASETGATIILHTPEKQSVYPESRLNAAALEFAKRCASYKAATGKFASDADLVEANGDFVASPVETVGLGDTFSCAYFLLA
ncbi:MAG: hypothetical protein NTV88_03460 [Candidatus Micrarchaeota archaeon]|nr:hypothetical protein [Candidatus Micrarchaeota archaeon]